MSQLYKKPKENSSFEWVSFNTLITGSNSSPTFGTTQEFSNYFVIGKLLHINFRIRQTSAGTPGSGAYYFSLPHGFTIDGSKVEFDDSSLHGSKVGTCYIHGIGTNRLEGVCVAFAITQYRMYIGPDLFGVDSGNYHLGLADITYAANLVLPIN